MIRAILLSLILALTPIAVAQQPTVQEQVVQANNGVYYIRLHNYLPRWVSCYYTDEFNYFTFVIPPQTTTQWQPIYGAYEWVCN